MGGSHSKPVTIDISKYPGGSEKQSVQSGDDKGGYYYDSGSRRVLLTDDWFPDPEGIYRKFTHTPGDGCTIGDIKKGGESQTGFGTLTTYDSVSVYYWGQDHHCSTPLLVQLGEGNEYYIRSSGNTWTNANINTGNLRKKLDEQNCEKNKAHIIKIAEKSGYQCPGCTAQWIAVSPLSQHNYRRYKHIISSDTSTPSITRFQCTEQDQLGFPSLKDARSSVIKVYWNRSGTPLLIHNSQTGGGNRWFRRNKSTENTWSEIGTNNPNRPGHSDDKDNIKKLLELPDYHPQIVLDLSKSSGTYTDTTTDILITVRTSPIGDSYWRYQHSLCGGLFEATVINYENSVLSGIESSNDKLDSVTTYYYGDNPSDENNLLLVGLEKRDNSYVYYGRKDGGSTWILLDGKDKTSKLQDSSLTNKLKDLKEKLNADHQKQVIIHAVGGTVGGLATAGALVALAKVFWPAIVTSSATL
ncbi:hypothetical protein BEWA_048770 [Theileria equi strain WA]|uniref:Uncharacterized protein n=1 Tax=Theileria equi strain WA TaxID=1537102 RepID=L1LAV0_THEEQ|nr:hypothetical protein BEWA_048770 [Theileria equi strain WA]EKX72410.1 hypothetical protein BEWA_048770 [Theileria equi strain WA]|eukprot:XP_004831862.1 hypothetical protein BEWA_048770 [Theileria equi strain WA]